MRSFKKFLSEGLLDKLPDPEEDKKAYTPDEKLIDTVNGFKIHQRLIGSSNTYYTATRLEPSGRRIFHTGKVKSYVIKRAKEHLKPSTK